MLKTRRIFDDFQPYEWEISTQDIASSMGLRAKNVVRMDTNTSPFLPARSLVNIGRKIKTLLVNEYPDTSYLELRKALASYCDMSIDNFVATNGADEALDIISKTLLDAGDEVMIPTPTYSMFRIVSEIAGCRPTFVPRRSESFSLDLKRIEKKLSKKTKIVFLCSPNNPTGNSASLEDVKHLLDLCGEGITIVADEAYYEFSGRTFADLTTKHDNLLVVRTFSKAFSMAGVRVGYIIASKESVKKLNIVRPPNSLSVISLALAQSALKDTTSMKRNVKILVEERERCLQSLRDSNELEVFSSDANFLLFKVKDGNSEKMHKKLMKRGYVLRNLTDVQGIEGCLRMTISTPRTNNTFLRTIQSLFRQKV